MKVFIDGEEVKCNNDIKIIYEGQIIYSRNDKEILGELHITLNNEGMIADTLFNRLKKNKKAEMVYKSMWKTLEDIIEETH